MATFKFTDLSKSPFLVSDFSTNGPQHPDTSTLHLKATAANTSLIIVGKGLPEYGELVQSNVLHLLEHFASPTSPSFPIEGQAWYNNSSTQLSLRIGSVWSEILVNGNIQSALNVNTHKITNLSNPTLGTDAVNKQYADTTFVDVAGDTMTGALVLSGAPTLALHATSKLYVDTAISTATGSLASSTTVVLKTGSTMTGPLILNGTHLDITNTSSIMIAGGSLVATAASVIDFGNAELKNVGTPTATTDGTNKAYVDSQHNSAQVTGATIDTNTGILSLTTLSVPIPLTTAPVAPFTHTHLSGSIGSLPFTGGRSFIDDAYIASTFDLPTLSALDFILGSINASIRKLTQKTDRYITAGNGTTTIALPFKYPVHLDKLSVYKDGLKQYRDDRGEVTLARTSSFEIIDNSPLTNTTYAYNLTVDGILFTNVQVNLTAVTTTFAKYYDILRAINKGLTTPATTAINFTAAVTGASTTGLTTGVTYNSVIVVDGTSYTLSFLGENATTLGELATLINIQTNFNVTVTFSGTQMILTTVSRGSESVFTSITNAAGPSPAPLFSSLTNYTSVAAFVAGTTTAVVKYASGTFVIMSKTVSATSNVTIAAPGAGTNFLTSLSLTATSHTGTNVYQYQEPGIPTRYSTTVTFSAVTSGGSVYEFIVEPFALETSPSGLYV